MLKTLWVSFAQVVAAAVITYGCLTAISFAAKASGPYGDMSDGMGYVLAAIVLVPLGAMIVGPLVARKLRLAKWGMYSLSVVAVVVVMTFVLSNPGSSFANAPFTIIVLTALNLLIGYTVGMRRPTALSGPTGCGVGGSG